MCSKITCEVKNDVFTVRSRFVDARDPEFTYVSLSEVAKISKPIRGLPSAVDSLYIYRVRKILKPIKKMSAGTKIILLRVTARTHSSLVDSRL